MRSILNLTAASALLVVLVIAHPSLRVQAREIESPYTLIQNGLLVSGTGSKPVVGGAVLIHGDSIEAVGLLSKSFWSSRAERS